MDLIKIFTEATLTEQIAYILGIVGVVECFFIFYSKTREQILFFKFLCDVIWLANYLLLGNITGSVINGINMVREVVFYHRGKKKWATSHIWVAVFLIANLTSPVYSLVSGAEGLYALLPAIGSGLNAFAFYHSKPQATRAIGFVAQALWLTYTIYGRNLLSSVANIVLIISAVLGAIRQYRADRKEKQNTKKSDA
ncbi:MAG: YgjV family protein [Clostridia bacterium]|nr:YgjV family protein [Clostridia bacterium]